MCNGKDLLLPPSPPPLRGAGNAQSVEGKPLEKGEPCSTM